MLASALARLARLILKRPNTVLFGAAIPALLLVPLIFTVPQDLSFRGVLNRHNPQVAQYFDTISRLHLGGQLPLLLEGPEAKLDAAVKKLVPALRVQPSVREVIAKLPEKALLERAPFLVPQDTFRRWLGLALHPEETQSAKQLAKDLQTLKDNTTQTIPKGIRIVEITLQKDPMEMAVGSDAVETLDALTQKLLQGSEVKGTYAGLPAIAAQDQVKTLSTVQKLTPITFLLVMLLFRLVEKRTVSLLFVSVPMLLAMGATLGITGAMLRSITVMETFFGLMVFGLGVDFALHLIVRMHEERSQGADFDTALIATMRGAGPGIISGALTTAGAFFVVAAAPDPSARHLGLSGGFGLSICLFLMLTTLPALWTLAERRHASEDTSATLHHNFFSFVGVLARYSTRHPRFVLLGTLVLVVGSLFGVPRFHFETDLKKVFNRDVPALAATERLREAVGLNAGPWLVPVKSLDELRRLDALFRSKNRYSRVDSLAPLLPKGAQQREKTLHSAHNTITDQIAVYGQLKRFVDEDEGKAIDGAIKLLQMLLTAEKKGPFTIDSIPSTMRNRFLDAGGEYILYAYENSSSLDGAAAAEARKAVQAIAPQATGLAAVLEAMMVAKRPWLAPVFFSILAFVLLVLVFDMRSAPLVLLALAPVCVGTAVSFGLLCWVRLPFNVLTVTVVPLVVGLGVDDGIHVVHRLKGSHSLSIAEAAQSVGRAVVMTTATTCASFAALLFTNHAGLEGMALVMLIGLPTCMLASITTLPALATLFFPDRV